MQTFILLGVIVGALALFATEKLRADLIAILVTAVLAVSGLISVEQAFAGFSSPAVITVAAVFVLSAGFIRTGGAEHLTRALRTLGGRAPWRITLAVVLLVGVLSSFMNNIGATIILMPAVIAVAREARMNPSRLLIPLAFGSLLGGLTTLIGTPPNLLISLILAEHGYVPFGVFDFTPVGLLLLAVGALFLVVIGPRLLPARDGGADGNVEGGIDGAGAGEFRSKSEEVSSEVLLEPPPPDRERAGQIVSEFGLRLLAFRGDTSARSCSVASTSNGPARLGTSAGALERWDRRRPAPSSPRAGTKHDTTRADATLRVAPPAEATLREVAASFDDTLLVAGDRDNLLRAVATRKVRLLAELKHPPNGPHADGETTSDLRLAEATLAPRSSLAGKTLMELDFYNRYGLTVIGIRRHGESIRQPLAELRLRFGDTLLLRGPKERIQGLAPDGDFLLLEPIENRAPNYSRLSRAVLILVGVLITAASGLLHIALATILGAVAMVLSGCLRSEEVHRAIDWRTVIAIAGMIPLSTALETTGTAGRIALFITGIGSGHGPFVACALLGLATVILTQIMTNAAAAILVAPIGIGVAQALSVSPHPILMVIAVAASTAFITPIGHQSNILVYNAGGYRFKDFVRIGLPLTALILAVTLLVVPVLWPF